MLLTRVDRETLRLGRKHFAAGCSPAQPREQAGAPAPRGARAVTAALHDSCNMSSRTHATQRRSAASGCFAHAAQDSPGERRSVERVLVFATRSRRACLAAHRTHRPPHRAGVPPLARRASLALGASRVEETGSVERN